MIKDKFMMKAVLVAALVIWAAPSYAQDTPQVAPEQQTVAPADSAATPAAPPAGEPVPATSTATPAVTYEGGLNPNDINPVVFSYWERAAINDARNYRGQTRAPTEEELMRSVKSPAEAKKKPPPEEREIKLGGIVFVDSSDWAIWLNGKRVTPTAIPREVMDLKVYKEYVEMKWFDDYTNQIFPLRIRAHERFNIDARIFLPG